MPVWCRKYLALIAVMGLSACSGPLLKFEPNRIAFVQTSLSHAGITDARAEYRATFCRLVGRELTGPDAVCEQWLTRLADEPSALNTNATAAPTRTPAFDIVLVNGIFGECLESTTRLLDDGVGPLQRLGYRTSFAPVRGRGSSAENAKIIRAHVLDQAVHSPGRKTLIVSYSKGTADTLTALAAYPDLAAQVVAVLSLAGVVNGSPLADHLAGLYASTFANLPYRPCPIVDKHEMDSISRAERQAWLSRQHLPAHIRYFSIAGAPAPERVSNVLKPFYDQLARVDPFNDGQMLFHDAVIPGGTLLGYVNADHWAIALPLEITGSAALRPFIDKNHFPRDQMLRAAITVIEDQILAAIPGD
jgi:hypothetical protein